MINPKAPFRMMIDAAAPNKVSSGVARICSGEDAQSVISTRVELDVLVEGDG
jgi:hypothetical protein